jgi:CDP-glycerol glycerophosphotransferase (TagB/SpsB family)
MIFPGPIVKDTDKLFSSLDQALTNLNKPRTERYQMAQRIFYKYVDSQNSFRVVEQVKEKLHD